MSVVVFVGPTLERNVARAVLDARYLPPASQGDVYRAAREKPFCIGIIDGYFERVPAVWHKEILWAMAQGIHVFGAASMGALRAAELASYGMRGVGRVFRAFHTGELEDDDEVAIAHGEESTGYRVMSEAMVNIRATLRSAVAAGIVDESVAGRCRDLAKGFFYPDRTYANVLSAATAAGVPARDVSRLRDWLSAGRVDEKRADALELLHVLKDCRTANEPPERTKYSMTCTDRWERLVEWADAQPALLSSSDEG
jgi:hypothetical protein